MTEETATSPLNDELMAEAHKMLVEAGYTNEEALKQLQKGLSLKPVEQEAIKTKLENESIEQLKEAVNNSDMVDKIIAPWLLYPSGDTTKKPKVDTNILATEFFKRTHFFNTSAYIAGYIYNGWHWKRMASERVRDITIRNYLTNMLDSHYTANTVKSALQIILDKSLDDDLINAFEQNFHVASFKNMAINVETLETMENSYTLYNLVGFNYDLNIKDKPTASTTFVTNLLGEGAQFMYEYIGYMFKRQYEPFQTFVIVQGKAGTGKSTLFNLITKILGKHNISNASLQELAKDKFMAFQLVDKSANIRSDLSRSFVKDAANIKNIVGDDSTEVQNKGGQPFPYKNHAKLLFSANETPAMTPDQGIDRRAVIVPVTGDVHATTNTAGNFDFSALDDELGAFAYYCIQQFSKAYKAHKWSTTDEIQQVTKEWLNKGDDIKAWAQEHLIKSLDHRPTALLIYDLFKNDMLKDGIETPISARVFYKRLEELGYIIKKGKTTNDEDDKQGETLRRVFDTQYVEVD